MFTLTITRSALRNVVSPGRAAAVTAARYSSTRLYSSTMHDNDPELLDIEKAKNLSQKQHGSSTPHPESAPGWNEHLASASEASVKADRHTGSADESLQRKTVSYIHSRHQPDDVLERRESMEERDEIGGPLGQQTTKTRVEITEEEERRTGEKI